MKSLKHIELSYLNEFSGGDHEIIREVLKMFITQMTELLNEMKSSYFAGDWRDLRTAVHSAKSSFQVLGATSNAKLMLEFEMLAKDAISTELYSGYIRKFEALAQESSDEAQYLIDNEFFS